MKNKASKNKSSRDLKWKHKKSRVVLSSVGLENRIVQRVSLMCLRLCKVCPSYQSWISQDKYEEKQRTLDTKSSAALKFQFTVGFTYWGFGYIWEHWNKKPANSVKKSWFACEGVMIFQIKYMLILYMQMSVLTFDPQVQQSLSSLSRTCLCFTGHDAILTSAHAWKEKVSSCELMLWRASFDCLN